MYNSPLLSYSNSSFQFLQMGADMAKNSNQGNVFFVRPHSGSDGQDGRSPQTAFKTLATALGACTANQNDIVYMMAESNTAGNTTDYQSVALDWNKDSVHLIGINGGSFIGQRSRISNLSTATAIVNGMFIVSANNCMIQGLEIFQGQGGTNPTGASIAMKVSGQRNAVVNCQISGIGHSELDDATSRSLSVTGAENYFQKCYIGLDTTIRATATTEVECANARNIFEDCIIESYTSLSTFKAITTASSTVGRFVVLKNTMLCAIQNITSAVAPTGAIAHDQSGSVYMQGGGVFGYANVVTADNANVLVSAPAGGLVDMGLATGVDIAP